MNRLGQKFFPKLNVIVLFTIIFTLFFYLPAFATNENETDSIIVQTKDIFLRFRRPENLLLRNGIRNFTQIKRNTYVLPREENKSIKEQIAELKENSLFKLVEPNYKLSIDNINTKGKYTRINKITDRNTQVTNNEDVLPNDRGFASQYYLRQIDAPKAWNITVGKPILVAVLDTGVDSTHPDLIGKVIGRNGHDEEDLTDNISHGTGVAGIIAAHTNNKEGIAGLSWNTKILSIRITDEYGQARVSDVIEALEEVYKQGANIVQISLSTNQFSEALRDAIQEALDKGILLVSTGGNTGINEVRFPAGFDGVIGAGAVAENGEIESYSTRGEHISLVAPGTDIYTTAPNLSYHKLTGTSFSAPQIAGTAALIWSIAPNLTSSEVRDILFSSAIDLGSPDKDNKFGFGLLNTRKAVELAKEVMETNTLTKEWIHR